MRGVIEGTSVSARKRAGGRRATTLSICCMTSGRRPALLAGVLASLRGVADEIVVAVEATTAERVYNAVAGVADRVLAFPQTSPADRPIAWLFGACKGTWIFNVDDDEVPSPSLVAALPELVERKDITHAWVARRWLYPTLDTYIASAPWGTEFQLRLALADERFLHFSDDFHRPVVCHGPSAYVEAPLWHLDTVLNPAAQRRLKAAAYERERPGMRFAGVAHNLGTYLPEVHPGLELLPVADAEREAIAAARAFPVVAPGEQRATLVHASAVDVDRDWVGEPFPESLYRATLALLVAPAVMTAGVQQTVDVCVTNESDTVWRWGRDSRPEIRLAYRWRRGDDIVPDARALRTSLPADLPPGSAQLVPVHVVAPEEPGAYTLEVDLVHEQERWFGSSVSAAIVVRPPRRIAVVARADRLAELVAELELDPEVEPVVVLRDPCDRDAYGDYVSVAGLRQYLLDGTEGRSKLTVLARLLVRTLLLARHSRRAHWSRPEYASLFAVRNSTERLVVDGPNWALDAAFGREWAWVAVTALLWRLDGRPVAIADGALPGGSGLRTASVRWVLRRLRSS